MANIRVSYALTSSLVAAVSTVAISVSAAGGATVVARPENNIQISAFVVPMEYLEEQTVIASDFRSLSFGKGIVDPTDSVEPTEQIAFAPDIVLTDSVTMYDVVYKDVTEVVDYDRNDADVDPDPVTVADTTAITFATSKSDAVTATDSPVADVQTVRADNVTASDAATKAPGKVLTDAATASDSAVLAPGKVTTDSVTASDTAPVFAQNKTTTDTVAASDTAPVFNITQVLTDSAIVAESISLLLIPGITTPWYDVAFASDEKFTYQWTLGTINSHLVHQPLVNGEFLLTTNPNAGIVYTIRTESVEYTYNGYGLNENQLN